MARKKIPITPENFCSTFSDLSGNLPKCGAEDIVTERRRNRELASAIEAICFAIKSLSDNDATALELIDSALACFYDGQMTEGVRRFNEAVYRRRQREQSMHDMLSTINQATIASTDNIRTFSQNVQRFERNIADHASAAETVRSGTDVRKIATSMATEARQVENHAREAAESADRVSQQIQAAEERIRELETRLAQTSHELVRDALTGAFNRKGLLDAWTREFSRFLRAKDQFCVCLLDIDNFKKLNDTSGHDAGDGALIHLVGIINEGLRLTDVVARYGGEEFVILLPSTGLEQAVEVTRRLQRSLTKNLYLSNTERTLITFSAGVTPISDADTLHEAIKRADMAMYRAKRTGKNKVVAIDVTSKFVGAEEEAG